MKQQFIWKRLVDGVILNVLSFHLFSTLFWLNAVVCNMLIVAIWMSLGAFNMLYVRQWKGHPIELNILRVSKSSESVEPSYSSLQKYLKNKIKATHTLCSTFWLLHRNILEFVALSIFRFYLWNFIFFWCDVYIIQ